MKIWEVRVIGSLEHVSLEVHVGDLVNLENLLFIHLFQGKEPVMQIDEGHLSVRATAKIFYQLKVFHWKILEGNRLFSVSPIHRLRSRRRRGGRRVADLGWRQILLRRSDVLLARSLDSLARNFHACWSLVGAHESAPMLLLLVHLLIRWIAASLMLDIQVTLIVLLLLHLIVCIVQCICTGLDFLVCYGVARCMARMASSLQRQWARQVTSWFPLIRNAVIIAASENLRKAETASLLPDLRRPLLHIGASTARSAHLLCVVESLAWGCRCARFTIKLCGRRDKNRLIDSIGSSLGCQQPLSVPHIRWGILIIVVWAGIRTLFPRHLAIWVWVLLVIMKLLTGCWGISLLHLSHHERYLHFLLLIMLVVWLFNAIHRVFAYELLSCQAIKVLI